MAGPLANSKHEQVAQATFAGSTLAEAAAAGGFTGKWPESHACNILKRLEVRQRLGELHKLAADEKIMTMIQRKIRLSEIARAHYNDPDRNGDPIRAIDILNKMCGDYAPNRTELTGPNGGPIHVEDVRERLLHTINRLSERISINISDTSEEDNGEDKPQIALSSPEHSEEAVNPVNRVRSPTREGNL